MIPESIKKELLARCQQYIDERVSRIKNKIADIQESLTSETKSTAGDKHETGRAMLQLEREKAGHQLAEIQKLQQILAKVSTTSDTVNIRLGSVVYTTQANYYISISAGVLQLENEQFYAIAPDTPIGKLLIGKQAGDLITFNQKTITITKTL
ncbi:3-oxoacyl-ACP synthase [Aquimarina hainanensis]|uniref:3-oxoacyl-ACP synthase n=1 Tax=Aquimarina hainanensis TaxID=1578017 RepID=A0ABW5N344_9FLAO|nr:3-oxoacyl-ACP synthase [Aquimarina sp. TRL1]QKX04586.1 3-oxoacyl-ACP synthase [Aquimarina sp. TRL1]